MRIYREKERYWFTPQVAMTARVEPIRIQEPEASSGLHTLLVHDPKALAILNGFARPQAVSWMGTGTARE